jgi:fructose-1,6-bisphosphatase I
MNLTDLFDGFKEISEFLRFNNLNLNDRLSIKNECNNILINSITKIECLSGYIYQDSIFPVLFYPRIVGENNYIISFSSLDGSKNIINNGSLGSIFCIYKYDPGNNYLKEILLSGYCLYGTKTILVTSDGKLAKQHFLNKNNEFEYINDINIADKNNNMYSMNLSNSYDKDMTILIQHFNRNNYNLRWIGSMVADCHQVLVKGGVFLYPMCNEYPSGRLNFLIQVLPLCFVFKGAGGVGIVGNRKSILDSYISFNLNESHCKYLSDIILCNENEYKNIVDILDIEENIRC